MTKLGLAALLGCGIMLVFAGCAHAPASGLPDPLAAGSKSGSICEKIHEDARQRILRCIFAPGAEHEKHYHAAHVGYVLESGRMRVTDARGVREMDLRAGHTWVSEGVEWHEALNIGDTTTSYLIIEVKE